MFWRGVTHDITRIAAAEEELRASETWHRALVEQLPAVVYVQTDEPTPRTTYVSPNAREIIGYEPDVFVGATNAEGWVDLVHPDDRERARDEWNPPAGAESFISEYRLMRPNGTAVWVRDTARLVHDRSGNDSYWHGVMLDVGTEKQAEEEERRRAERAAMEAEARFRALVEGSRRRLRDGAGRRAPDPVREPPDRGAARVLARGVARPARHLDRAAASRRSRDRARGARPAQPNRSAAGLASTG